MTVKILYFSGTGNTKLITEKIKYYLSDYYKDIELITAEEIINNYRISNFDNKDSILGIGFPVYDLNAPGLISKAINKLPDIKKPLPVFIYSTQAFIKGDCLNIIAGNLRKKGYYTIIKKGFNCPSNGISFYEKPTHNRYKHIRFEKNIEQSIKIFSEKIADQHNKFKIKNFHNSGFISFFYNLIRFLSRRLYGEKYYKNLDISSSCNLCKLCEKRCPDNNLYSDNNKMNIKNINGCLRCLRCISICPKEAVSFTSSKKIGIYNKEIIMELYNKANKT